MEHHTLKNVNKCLNTNIYFYLATSGGQSSNLHLNVVHFFNTSVNYTSVAAEDSCFPSLVSNTCYSIKMVVFMELHSEGRLLTYVTELITVVKSVVLQARASQIFDVRCQSFGQSYKTFYDRNLRILIISFVPGKPFQPSLMFVGEARRLP
jgi:hypothetical protein